MTAIELKNINKDYGTGISKVQVLSDVSFKAHSGELSLVLGPLDQARVLF
jgi:putative ABC transport system ATP-binding protein